MDRGGMLIAMCAVKSALPVELPPAFNEYVG